MWVIRTVVTRYMYDCHWQYNKLPHKNVTRVGIKSKRLTVK